MASSSPLGRKQHACTWEWKGLWGKSVGFFFPVVVKFFLWFFLLLFYFGFWGGWSLCPVRKGEPQCLVLQSHATKPHCMGSEQYWQQGRLRDYSSPYPTIPVVSCMSVSICVYCTDETKTLIFPFLFELVITALTQTCAHAVDVSPFGFSAFEKDRRWRRWLCCLLGLFPGELICLLLLPKDKPAHSNMMSGCPWLIL